MRQLNFSRKVAASLAVVLAFAVLITAVSLVTLRSVTASKDHALTVGTEELLAIERLRLLLERKRANVRGLLLSGDPEHVKDLQALRQQVLTTVDGLRANVDDDRGRRLVDEAAARLDRYFRELDALVENHRAGVPADRLLRQWDERVVPTTNAVVERIDALAHMKRAELEDARTRSTETARTSIALLVLLASLGLGVTLLSTIMLSRALTRQVGSAVQHLQTSSTQLQASAQQQATTAKQQASATTEVTSTVQELLASSRQIGDSAQRVAAIAEKTASAAEEGQDALGRAEARIGGIRQQVDRIVAHMLDLARKSQQIGTILEIINELNEQTNILAINAAIEAARAGESGRRFGVVADEIRKLADRVATSTQQIRELVEEISAAST
ncbi:MAG: methyl-accepting chemotaxis protein, partial [Myxococcales bacterium]